MKRRWLILKRFSEASLLYITAAPGRQQKSRILSAKPHAWQELLPVWQGAAETHGCGDTEQENVDKTSGVQEAGPHANLRGAATGGDRYVWSSGHPRIMAWTLVEDWLR